jgi:S-adenosyl-L-methionine hydrolase (adenosine-forming)
MPRARPPSIAPIIALLSDFGLCDSYVAEMKAVLLKGCPAARLVDVTHGIAPQDVLAGSIILERALRAFEEGTVHLAVVDPGVGTDRRILAAKIHGQTVVCPDNGLITWAWHRLAGPRSVYEITWRPNVTSATFHGRDVMAPVAARLAAGRRISAFARPLKGPVLLDVAPAKDLKGGKIIHIDHFGNATTNVPAELIAAHPNATLKLVGTTIGPIRRTYADVAVGKPLALVGSSGLLEIAVRNGSAAKSLNLKVGQRLTIDH